MVRDLDLLQVWIDNWDQFIMSMKVIFANELESLVKDNFNNQGQAVRDTDPLNPRGINPKWKELSQITKTLKGSDTILEDTRQLVNNVRWQIEDSEWDDMRQVVKVGFFEELGEKVWIAAVHEFGLTGQRFRTPEGEIMGGDPIGRTPQARAKVRWWYNTKTKTMIGGKVTQSGLNMKVSGVVIIPERSMLRKAADFLVPKMEEIAETTLNDFLAEATQFL
jgi:hypothetical protein